MYSKNVLHMTILAVLTNFIQEELVFCYYNEWYFHLTTLQLNWHFCPFTEMSFPVYDFRLVLVGSKDFFSYASMFANPYWNWHSCMYFHWYSRIVYFHVQVIKMNFPYCTNFVYNVDIQLLKYHNHCLILLGGQEIFNLSSSVIFFLAFRWKHFAEIYPRCLQ